MKRKIRRRCKCGCGGITNYGKMYVLGHQNRGQKFSETHKKNISLARKGIEFSDEHKLNLSLAHIKNNPGNPYCGIWKDEEYKKDLKKDYCENADCKRNFKYLCNHHIYLDKKKCAPIDIMTLCNPCHCILHHALQEKRYAIANPKDFIIINRPDHLPYIHKKTHKIIRINKAIK